MLSQFLAFVLALSAVTELYADESCSPGVQVKLSNGTSTQYSSVETAIAAAPSGSTVTVGGGEYLEKVKIQNKNNLSITTTCGAKLQSLSIKSSKYLYIKGFAFNPKSNGEDHIVLFENNQFIVLDSMDISSEKNDGNKRNGVRIENLNQDVYIVKSMIRNNEKNGVKIRGAQSSVILKDNILEYNGMNGLLLEENTRAISLSNTFKSNGYRGISESHFAIAREGGFKTCTDVLDQQNSFIENSQNFKNRDQICADPDADSDGVPDALDNRPLIYNPQQNELTSYPVGIGMSSLASSKYTLSSQNSEGIKYITEISTSSNPGIATFGGIIYRDSVQIFFGKNSFNHSDPKLDDFSLMDLDTPTFGVSDFDIMGPVYDFKVLNSNYQFNEPIQLTMRIPNSVEFDELGKVRIETFNFASGSWESLGGEVDPLHRTITARVPHFSILTTICHLCKDTADGFSSFFQGASVTLSDVWNAIVVNAKGLGDFLGDVFSGDYDLWEHIKRAISECSDIGQYWERIKDASKTEAGGMLAYGSIYMSWTANCAAHWLSTPPEYIATYPSPGLSQFKTPLKRAVLEMWSKKVSHEGDYHDAMLLCDGLVSEDKVHGGSKRKHCSTGDGLIFSSLLNGAAQNSWIEKGFKDSVDPDGRPWRSPEDRKYPTFTYKDFSKDATLGLLIYLAKSRDRATAVRVRDYLVEHNGFICPYTEIGEPFSQCYVSPNLQAYLEIIINMTGTGGRNLTAAELNLYDEWALKDVQGRRKESAFEYHLSGAIVYLRHITGTMTPKVALMANELYSMDPSNLFFKYIYKLTNASAPFTYEDIADELIEHHIKGWVEGHYATEEGRREWVWNRPTQVDAHKPKSLGWEYLFIAALLDSDIKIYKDDQDLSQLTLPPPGMYFFSTLYDASYYILYPGNIQSSNFDYRYCKVSPDEEFLAFLKGWGVTNKGWNGGAHFLLFNPTIDFDGPCTPPIIAESGSDPGNIMPNDKILDLAYLNGSVLKAFEYSINTSCADPRNPEASQTCAQSALNCQKACLIDRSCKAINLTVVGSGDDQRFRCIMLSSFHSLSMSPPTPELGLVHTSRKYSNTPQKENSGVIGCTTSRTSNSGERRGCEETACFSVQSPLGFIKLEETVNSLVYHDEAGSEHSCSVFANQVNSLNFATEVCLTARARSHSGYNAGPGRIYCSFDIIKHD
jgi:hypothetical protein